MLVAVVVAVAMVGPAPAQAPATQPVAEARQPGFDSIDPDVCREWLEYLASDELGGRETGTPGYKLAAEFIAARFAEFGLRPVGDDGTYFQRVPFARVGPDLEKSHVVLIGEAGVELLRVQVGEGLGGRISEKSDRELGAVVLVAESAEDVDAVDVEGKAVVLFDESPRGRRGSEARSALRSAGSGVVFTVDDAAAARVTQRITAEGRRRRVQSARFRAANRYSLTEAVAEQFRAVLAKHPDAVLRVHIEIAREPVFAANVLGLFEGSDPQLKAEIVGIGSHLDHIGSRGEVINNGADDDGSGSVGVHGRGSRAGDKTPVPAAPERSCSCDVLRRGERADRLRVLCRPTRRVPLSVRSSPSCRWT